LSPARAIAGGTLTVGALDALDAMVFFGMRSGVAPHRIFQSIAAGLLGRAAFQGGAATAWLGVALHFFIAFTIVLVFVAASRRVNLLTRYAVPAGIVYGLAVYVVMNFVVLPLSAAGKPALSAPVLANGLLIHAFGVGVPAALFARAASVSKTTRR
jgi:hypothetical protein